MNWIDDVMIYENEPIFCKPISFIKNDLLYEGYICQNRKREDDQLSYFPCNLLKKSSAIEKFQVKLNVSETIDSIASQYGKYFIWGIEDGKSK